MFPEVSKGVGNIGIHLKGMEAQPTAGELEGTRELVAVVDCVEKRKMSSIAVVLVAGNCGSQTITVAIACRLFPYP